MCNGENTLNEQKVEKLILKEHIKLRHLASAATSFCRAPETKY